MGHRAIYILKNEDTDDSKKYQVYYNHWAMPMENFGNILEAIIFTGDPLDSLGQVTYLGAAKTLNQALGLNQQQDLEMVYVLDYSKRSFAIYFGFGAAKAILQKNDLRILKYWDYPKRQLQHCSWVLKELGWRFRNTF